MKYLIPLVSRGPSASSKDNVLAVAGLQENIFIMDNHRLALWCWFSKMKKESRYNFFHIDAHPDMSESAISGFNHDLWNLTLDDYRTAWAAEINEPLFRWDNYIEVFLQKYPECVGKTYSATHHLGSSKNLSVDIKPYDLVKTMNGIFSGESYVNDFNFIVNLDLDYFFSAAPEKHVLFSESYIDSLVRSIAMGLDSGLIEILTISLSPECCGSWEKAEGLLKRFGYHL